MKVAILAAGFTKYFPLLMDKPKCMYHLDGKMLLEEVIQSALDIVPVRDIIVVTGYKSRSIREYLKENHPGIDVRFSEHWADPAIYSFRKAVEGIDDDVVFMFGDERIMQKNVRKIASSDKKAAILVHNIFPYFSVGIIKLRRDGLSLLSDDYYLSMDYIKKIYCFANRKDIFDGDFSINSGICITYILIDLVRRAGHLERMENPLLFYKGDEIDCILYDAKKEYLKDLDYIFETDEYAENRLLRIYSDYVSEPIKRILVHIPGSLYYQASLPQKTRGVRNNTVKKTEMQFLSAFQLGISIQYDEIQKNEKVLWQHMMENDDEMLIVERDGIVEGIVTPGDVLRCYENGVSETEAVNRRFSYVESETEEQKAAEIFMKYPGLHQIPVIQKGIFTGVIDHNGKRKSEEEWRRIRLTLEDLYRYREKNS